jgi:hypothetical protein
MPAAATAAAAAATVCGSSSSGHSQSNTHTMLANAVTGKHAVVYLIKYTVMQACAG